MSKSNKSKPVDPTVETVGITLNDVTYSLAFDFESLAQAEQELNAEGHGINLLACLPVPNLSTIRPLFAAAVRKFHPDLDYHAATKLVTPFNASAIATTLLTAWNKSLPEPEPKGNVEAGE
jgi:hypothetical protein